MQLVRQEKLHFKDGKSDKIYEVELYHIQSNEYVVNFRYGRRGGNLKEGTKTVFPVQKDKAEKVFDDLVASKTKKGYQLVQSYDDTIEQSVTMPIEDYELSGARAVVLTYLNQKARGELLKNKWRLSRIIWRAGELEIEEAVPAIKELFSSLQGQEIYSAVWTLGRIASDQAKQVLRSIPLDPQSLHYRIQLAALICAGDKDKKEDLIRSLPETLQTSYRAQSYQSLAKELGELLQIPNSNSESLLSLYYLSIHDPSLKKCLNEILVDISVVPGKWRYLRYIYKIAEMIKDGATFGLIARLVNLRSSNFRNNRWSDKVWLNGRQVDKIEALTSEEPQLAFSSGTKEYFVRRTLRRLRKAGVDKMESYCALASGILIAYSEGDELEPYHMNFYQYNPETRRYFTNQRRFPKMARVPYFYYILFAQGNRYHIPSALQQFYGSTDVGALTSREDSFAELWDRYPQYAVKVLAHCKQKDAMEFGFMVLKGRPDLSDLLDLDSLLSMIFSPFTKVLDFSLDYIEKKYDPKNPNERIIFQLILSENQRAADLAVELLNKNNTPFIQNVNFLKLAILSKVESIQLWLREHIKEDQLTETDVSLIVAHCLSEFKNSDEEDTNNFPQETMVQIFPVYLRKLTPEKILELIHHPQLQVQLLGAKLINLNEMKPEQWPDDVMIRLLSSEHGVIREEGMNLFASLTNQQLLEKTEFIIHLASSEHQNLRIKAREVISRLAVDQKEFGESVLFGLYDVLIKDHEDEELPIDVYDTIETHLLPYSGVLKPELEEMLKSNHREVHLLTYHLLENENINEWPVRQVARLGAHDMNKVRQKSHRYFELNIDRVKYEKFDAIHLLDTDWEETRTFGRTYFDQHFTAEDWEPELVIALCDNVRPETQEYGTRILGQYFKEDQGVEYLTALSEHPDPIIELYSTNYLHQYALNNQTVLDQLKPYFTRSLGAINTRRVAKQRVFHFLEKQAGSSLEGATYVADILNELVGTIVVQENERYVSLLHELKQRHPELEINIAKVPLEIR